MISWVLTGAAIVVLAVGMLTTRFPDHQWCACLSLANVLACAGFWLWDEPLFAAMSGAYAVIFAVIWWRGRRKRKRAAREVGAKSRALIAALVARVRESATPRPVLRPAPGGAS